MGIFSDYKVYPFSGNSKVSWIDTFAVKFHYSYGYCPVCGNITIFENFNENLRESGVCAKCASNNRQRQMSVSLLQSIYEISGIKFSSLQEFSRDAPKFERTSKIRIYNTEMSGSVHHYLCALEGYTSSEYLGHEYKSGEIIQGILHQDLTATSFSESYFDIVMSSDVFEHIPDPYAGFSEIHRILKPSGRHIFTVPFYGDRFCDELRSVLEADGSTKHILPPMYHGDPIRPEGILVYYIFSLEMLVKLSCLGFETAMQKLRIPRMGILGSNALVFTSSKREQ